jgi:hypothetical protein
MIEYYPDIDSAEDSDGSKGPEPVGEACVSAISRLLAHPEKLAAAITPLEPAAPKAEQSQMDIYLLAKQRPEYLDQARL